MNNHGVGWAPQSFGNEMLMLCLLLMMCPGLFGGMGENPMMLIMLLMIMSGGRLKGVESGEWRVES